MANYNKVFLIGNLTRDPQLSFLPSQTPVLDLGMAINRKWKDKDGQQKEETCFVDLTAFGKQAETLNQYVTKGSPLMVEGRLHFSSWKDKEGKNRSKLKVVVENFQFLGKAQDSAAPQGRQAGHAKVIGSAFSVDDNIPDPAEEGDSIPF